MAENDQQKLNVQWDRRAYDAMAEGWSTWRQRRDAKKLKKIFRLAKHSPTMKAALDWAEAHDLRFFVDHKTEYLGYYTTGTGVLGISKKILSDPAEAVNTITHEIRHAWQEYNDLNSGDPPTFAENFIHVGLIEADATAHGNRAEDEYISSLTRRHPSRELEEKLADKTAYFGSNFLSWFSDEEGYTREYGKDVLAEMGKRYTVETEPEDDGNVEFKVNPDVDGVKAIGGSIDIGNVQDVLRLGTSFDGASNYLAALDPDALPRQVLSRSLADTFWGTAKKKDKAAVADIRKAAIREKLAQPKVKHPWP